MLATKFDSDAIGLFEHFTISNIDLDNLCPEFISISGLEIQSSFSVVPTSAILESQNCSKDWKLPPL
jgi:hypothetical protein